MIREKQCPSVTGAGLVGWRACWKRNNNQTVLCGSRLWKRPPGSHFKQRRGRLTNTPAAVLNYYTMYHVSFLCKSPMHLPQWNTFNLIIFIQYSSSIKINDTPIYVLWLLIMYIEIWLLPSQGLKGIICRYCDVLCVLFWLNWLRPKLVMHSWVSASWKGNWHSQKEDLGHVWAWYSSRGKIGLRHWTVSLIVTFSF